MEGGVIDNLWIIIDWIFDEKIGNREQV